MEKVIVVIPASRPPRSPPWFGAEARRALALGVAVAALALACGWPYWEHHPLAAVTALTGGGAFAAVGGLLWTSKRTGRTGLLLVLASASWAVNWLASWNAGVGPLVSVYAQSGFYIALSLGVLIYPGGRLERVADRAWIVAALVILWGGPTALMVTSEPEWNGFASSVWWPAPFLDRALFRELLGTLGVLYVVLALALAAVLLFKLPRMGRLERALAAPVIVAPALVGILAALTQRPLMDEAITLEDLLSVWTVQSAVAITVPIALLASAVRVRFGELAVAGRMLRLGSPVSVERVRDTLRDVLRDADLELWFWAPVENAYVDTVGRPIGPSPVDGTRWRREVRTAEGEPLAIADLRGSLREHTSLVDAALVASGRALETAQLQAAVQANLEQVRSAYERLVRAETAERERLVRDLHDGAQQRLLALAAMLGTLEAVAGDPDARALARQCREELLVALAELRSLVREARPALLVQDGIGPALEVAAEGLGARIRVDVPTGRFPSEIESTVFSVICELLPRAVERSPGGRVIVRIRPVERELIAEISDDGRDGTESSADISGIQGRIRALRGRVEFDDSARGSTVRIIVPCE